MYSVILIATIIVLSLTVLCVDFVFCFAVIIFVIPRRDFAKVYAAALLSFDEGHVKSITLLIT